MGGEDTLIYVQWYVAQERCLVRRDGDVCDRIFEEKGSQRDGGLGRQNWQGDRRKVGLRCEIDIQVSQDR
jgi:hypothetical protein